MEGENWLVDGDQVNGQRGVLLVDGGEEEERDDDDFAFGVDDDSGVVDAGKSGFVEYTNSPESVSSSLAPPWLPLLWIGRGVESQGLGG